MVERAVPTAGKQMLDGMRCTGRQVEGVCCIAQLDTDHLSCSCYKLLVGWGAWWSQGMKGKIERPRVPEPGSLHLQRYRGDC